MSAPAANTNAVRWTRQQTHDMLDQIEHLAWDETIHTLTQALLKLKSYKQLWSYWKKIWALDGDVMDRIYYIEQIFIHKLEEGALFKRLNPSACYFILRNNYGYDSKTEPELPSHLIADLEASAQTTTADTKENTTQVSIQSKTGITHKPSDQHKQKHPHNSTNTTSDRTTNFAIP